MSNLKTVYTIQGQPEWDTLHVQVDDEVPNEISIYQDGRDETVFVAASEVDDLIIALLFARGSIREQQT